MKYCRIDLSKTNYTKLSNWQYLSTFDQLPGIYKTYCEYKKFDSVMPLFHNQFVDTQNDVLGYYNGFQLVAFSLIKRHDWVNAEALQFAWDYANPELHLGIESLKHECAVYKERGFKYLYLGEAHHYKSQLDGFEILGKA